MRAGADADRDGKTKQACDESRAFIGTQFTELARQAGAQDPGVLGEQLALLYDGAAVAAQADGNAQAPLAARLGAAARRPLADPLLARSRATILGAEVTRIYQPIDLHMFYKPALDIDLQISIITA